MTNYQPHTFTLKILQKILWTRLKIFRWSLLGLSILYEVRIFILHLEDKYEIDKLKSKYKLGLGTN
jgi:hypothetical protein